MRTSTAIVTTQDDDMNIYLTIYWCRLRYCRRLRPDVQIISRTTVERYWVANAVLHYFWRGDT